MGLRGDLGHAASTAGFTYRQLPEVGCDGIDHRSGIAACRVHTRISHDGHWLVVHLKAVDVTKRAIRARYVGAAGA